MGGFLEQVFNQVVGGVVALVTNPAKAISDAISEVGKGVEDVLGGIFGAHTETTVATFISRCIPDNMLANSAKSGIFGAVLKEGTASDYILEGLVSGIALRSERAYAYSQKGYVYGTPTKKLFVGTSGEAVVKTFIKEQYTGEVDFKYYHFGKANYLHHVREHLVSDYGYDPESNDFSILGDALDATVYLKDIVLVVAPTTGVEQPKGVLEPFGTPATGGVTPTRFADQGRPPTPIEISPTATSSRARIVYTWVAKEPMLLNGASIIGDVIKEDSFYIDFVGSNAIQPPKGDVFQVCYVHAGKTYYWSYVAGSGTIQALDAVYRHKFDDMGSFYPMVHFRHNKQAVHPNKGTVPYKSSKKMLKFYGLDYDDVAASIAENPNISDIEQAFMTTAVPAVTKNPMEQRYLFDFFNGMYLAKVVQLPDVASLSLLQGSAGAYLPSTSMSLMIRDALIQMSLGCSEIRKRIVIGSIGKVDSYSSSMSTDEIKVVAVPGTTVSYPSEDAPRTITRHVYCHQLTADMYEEVSLFGLNLTYYIFGGHNTVALGDNANLLIPIDRAIASLYSLVDRELLLSRALHFVVNSRTELEVKWYQTSIFRDVLLIVAIALTVVSLGSSVKGYAALYASGALTLTAIAVKIAIEIAVIYAWQIAATIFVRVVGEENAAIAAIAMMAKACYDFYSTGSVQGAPFAKDLMIGATAVTVSISNSMGSKIKDLQREQSEFSSNIEAKEKELSDAQKLIERDHIATPILLGEYAKDYLKRSAHSGNIGVYSVGVVSGYVSAALTLPKMYETI